MSEPVIYVIPAEYYGGAFPKTSAHGRVSPPEGAPLVPAPARKFSTVKIAVVVVAVLFFAVVGGATWYFTRELKAPVPAPSLPTAEVPAPVSEPAPLNEPQAVPEPAVTPTPAPASPLPPGLSDDSDHDGMTEAEEVLYGTSASMPDTDSDGYLDGHELINLYNPGGTAPEKLEPTGFAVRYKLEKFPLELLYPRSWQVNPESDGKITVFQAGDGEAVSLTIVENLEKQPMAEWMVSHGPQTEIIPWTSNKQGVGGYATTSGDAVYLDAGNGQVAVFRYTPVAGLPRYQTTMKMMANSFSMHE